MSLSDKQLENAAIIIKVGDDLGATRNQILSALSAAWVESRLGTLDGGDNGTAWGIFQQRPVANWGSKNQVENPYYAANAFYTGAGGNPGLLDVWSNERSPGLNAQAVQHSAFPYRYDNAVSFARGVLRQIEELVGSDSNVSEPEPLSSGITKQKTPAPVKTADQVKSSNLQKILVLSVGLVLIILALTRLNG